MRLSFILSSFLMMVACLLPAAEEHDHKHDHDHDHKHEQGDGAGGEEQKTLHESMEIIGDMYKNLARNLRRGPDPAELPQYKEWAQTLLDELQASKEMMPPEMPGVPKDQWAEHVKAYKAKMDESIATTKAIQAKLEAGELEAAGELTKDLKDQKAEGHERFQPED